MKVATASELVSIFSVHDSFVKMHQHCVIILKINHNLETDQ